MRNLFLVLAVLGMHSSALASANRTLDGSQITNGAAVLTLPTTTGNVLTDVSSNTLTSKSISGSTNTFTNIPAATALQGAVPVANGGTASTSAAGARASLGAAANGANSDITSITGLTTPLSVGQGGIGASSLTSGSVLVGAGTSTPSLVAPGATGNVLTSNGSTWTSLSVPSMAPALNGGSAAPQSVTTAGITLAGLGYNNLVWVVGSPGPVIVSATPSISACTADGQRLSVYGTSATNTVKLRDQANLSGSGLSLNGDWVGGKDSVLSLHCDITQGLWVEDSRR